MTPSAGGRCPCSSGRPYDDCCGRYLSGAAAAPTAELLMRSRYTAYALRDTAHLLRSWHPSTRPERLDLDPEQQWTGLAVLRVDAGGLFDAEGTIEFRADWRHGRRRGSLHEQSRFVRDSTWLYVGPR